MTTPVFVALLVVPALVTSSTPTFSIWPTGIFALVFGCSFAVAVTYGQRRARRPLVEAVAGLDSTQRSEAIAAVTHGVVPPDQAVRHAAIRLGAACLRGKSAEQLKRQERRNWIALAFLIVLWSAVAVFESSLYTRLYLLALALFITILIPLSIRRTRRIQRNIAALSEGLTSR